jgi:myo-inositol-1-phosphate synthase
MTTGLKIKPADGKLGILTPGMGAVSSTFMAGVFAVRRGIRLPIGSVTQMGHIRLGKRTDNRQPMVKDFVPLASLDDIVFGGWDIFEDSVYEAAVKAGVLPMDLLNELKDELDAVKPMPAVFDNFYVKKLHGTFVKKGATKMDLAEQLMQDMKDFQKSHGCSRLVMVWCGSTEIFLKPSDVHQTIEAFEAGLRSNHPDIAPSMIYAYAAIKMGIPYANGAPNLSADIPALETLSKQTVSPTCGKDFKTGQTLVKTILAPGFKARLLGVSGWFSTNILGNRDGEVLDDPGSFKTKEESKLSVLDTICRDSILAAPIVLDLALFLDLSKRAGFGGIQEWLSFYLKSPVTPQGLYPEHDLFIQQKKMKNTLRWMMGEELVTHLGREYYDDLTQDDR